MPLPLHSIEIQFRAVVHVRAKSPVAAFKRVRRLAGKSVDMQGTLFGNPITSAAVADPLRFYPSLKEIDGTDATHVVWITTKVVRGKEAEREISLVDGTLLATVRDEELLGCGREFSVVSAARDFTGRGWSFGTATNAYYDATSHPFSTDPNRTR